MDIKNNTGLAEDCTLGKGILQLVIDNYYNTEHGMTHSIFYRTLYFASSNILCRCL